jgi:DNA gyrase subunit A
MVQVDDDDEVMMSTDVGKIIRLRVGDISVIGRNTQGVRLIEIEEGQKVTGVDRFAVEPLNGVDDANGAANGGAPPVPATIPPPPREILSPDDSPLDETLLDETAADESSSDDAPADEPDEPDAGPDDEGD